MNGFKFDFSKIFWGGAHRAPSPDPSPRFFSGFALGSGFALNSRALRALDSGFALDTRALRALDSGFALNFRLGTLVWPPQNKFLDPPLNRWVSLILLRFARPQCLAVTHLSSPEVGNGLSWPKPQCTCNAMVTSQALLSTNEGVLRSNSACSMLMSDDLRLSRRGIEPRPSGFRDIGSTPVYR